MKLGRREGKGGGGNGSEWKTGTCDHPERQGALRTLHSNYLYQKKPQARGRHVTRILTKEPFEEGEKRRGDRGAGAQSARGGRGSV